jgi:uncharacterized protein (TIGR02145 family)/prepilin-type N-terminal cleavage/methylation domain-containing protein
MVCLRKAIRGSVRNTFSHHIHSRHRRAFTIVELLIVIAVIGILAGIGVVGYGSWKKTANSNQVKSDLVGAAAAMESAKNFGTGYPGSIPSTFSSSSGVSLALTNTSTTSYCIDGSSTTDASIHYYIDSQTSTNGAQSGTCAARTYVPTGIPTGLAASSTTDTQTSLTWTPADSYATSYNLQCALDHAFTSGVVSTVTSGSPPYTLSGLTAQTVYYCEVNASNAAGTSGWSNQTMVATAAPTARIQTITSANCPSSRTRVVDARDNHTYWVQKLADGKCWMLTNLAYAGGGTNTYGDIKTLTNGTGGSSTYTIASYYVPTGANPTTEPTAPSTATNGVGQYGYLYNWCGAMGAQTSTSACANATTPVPDTNVSTCPSGWRLPTGNGGELGALNTAVNGGSSTTDAGLRTNWLSQYSGYWLTSFGDQGSAGYYWSSTQFNATLGYYWYLFSGSSYSNGINKAYGLAVRCLAT